jgi:hypothetical protein
MDADKQGELLLETRGTLEQSDSLHKTMSGATLEARPKTDGLTVRRGMKGKPKPLYFWDSADVNKWLRKHGGLYYELYGDLLSKHDVTGRTLIRINDIKLEKMGVLDASHRHDLMQFILRLRLKHEMSDLRSLNQRGSGFELKLPDTRQSSMDKTPTADKLPAAHK